MSRHRSGRGRRDGDAALLFCSIQSMIAVPS